jgi:hypothetical protein
MLGNIKIQMPINIGTRVSFLLIAQSEPKCHEDNNRNTKREKKGNAYHVYNDKKTNPIYII